MQGQQSQPEKKSSKNIKRFIWEYGKVLVTAVALALVVRSSLVCAYVVPTGSMVDTIQIGDRFVVSKISYWLRFPVSEHIIMQTGEIERGDVVVFHPPYPHEDPLIKRVIGLPGDQIKIINKTVFINGQPLNEPYARFADPNVIPQNLDPRDNFGPALVPQGKLFLMGDNRDRSYDSRYWGFVERSAVLGQAGFRYWSWDQADGRVRWSRLLSWVR